SVLLCALLREAGVEAHPALINTTMRDSLTDYLPAADIFDHCVVLVRLRDQDHWLDPTVSYQRGHLRSISFARFGRALVGDGAADSLAKIPDDCAGSPKTEVHEQFVIESIEEPVVLSVRTTLSGADADDYRSYLARTSRQEVEKDYLNFYAQNY